MKVKYVIYDLMFKTFYNGRYVEDDKSTHIDFSTIELKKFKYKQEAEEKLKIEMKKFKDDFQGRLMTVLKIYE